MADIRLKRGQTGSVTFSILDADGSPFDLTGYTVTLVIGTGQRFERVATLDTPLTLGTGRFDFDGDDYAKLRVRPDDYVFEVWATDGTNSLPVFSGTLAVVDVPQVTV